MALLGALCGLLRNGLLDGSFLMLALFALSNILLETDFDRSESLPVNGVLGLSLLCRVLCLAMVFTLLPSRLHKVGFP